MAEEQLNLYQKLAKIRKQVEVIQRNKKGYGYTYVSDDEILAKISGLMDKYGISLIPGVIHQSASVAPYHTIKTKTTNKGDMYEEHVNEILVSADMTFNWVDNEHPEDRIEVPWLLVGHQSDASQSFGSGLSYSMRYFLLKFFNIATPNDDPDNWRSKQRAAAAEEDKMVAQEIIERFDADAKAYLKDHPDDVERFKKFAARYAKGGNYFAITESLVASKLTADFKAEFLKEQEES